MHCTTIKCEVGYEKMTFEIFEEGELLLINFFLGRGKKRMAYV